MRLDQNFVRLPFRVDAERLALEIADVPEEAWRGHPQGAPGNTALTLLAVDGDPDSDSTHGTFAPTPHLASMPYVRQVMAALGSTIGRTRLMRIATETELGTHVDVNYYWWHHLRVHVPIVTDPAVTFFVDDEARHMAAGEVWVFNTWRNHRVDNPASHPRIHLVIDTVGGADLWGLIGDPDRDPIDVPWRPDVEVELPLETFNWPVVMPAAEVDATIGRLLDETRSVDPEGAARAARIVEPFRHAWHDLEARFGGSEPGWAAHQALVDAVRARIADELDDVRLPNQINLAKAVSDLVLGPALTPVGTRRRPPPAAQPARTPVGVDPVQRMLAGPPRIADPVFVVCPPRSGSSFLFETLQRSPSLYTIGGESHNLIEGIAALTPAAHDWESNRLTADDATDGVVSFLKDRFVSQLRDRNGTRPPGGATRLLEKTPKNALRVPFLARAFPDARFVYLYRDPRETISSMLDAWRSGRFVTYPDLPGWNGSPWSLLLTPGWRDLDGRPLAEVVTRQWAATVEMLLDDLEALDPAQWCVASYDRLVAEPYEEIMRLCDFLDIDWDDELAEPLPDSRHTLESPHPEKWRRNADELEPQLPIMTAAAQRAREVFSSPPRVAPVEAGESADRSRVRRRRAPVAVTPPPSGETDPDAPVAPTGPPATTQLSPEQLYASQFTNSFRVLLDQTNSSLLISTYQAGRLIMVRPTADGLNSHYRALQTPMGVAYDGRHLAVGTKAEVIVFQNQPALTGRLSPPDAHDGCFVVRRRHATGDIRVHDLAWADDGLWVVNTRFSCLATLDEQHSFVPRWRPTFVTQLAAEDRCHLNGLTVVDGAPKYVTVLGLTDENNGWRERKAEGGAIIDITNDEIVAHNLSMPHSPRWHNGKLWVLQSGIGTLGTVDLGTGRVETIATVPGFARGLTFIGQYALVGLSKVREHVFDGLPLTRDRTDELRCGVWVIDTETGQTVAHLSFEGLVQEIFEVAVLRGLRHPELVEPGAPLADTAYVIPDAAMADVAT